MCAYAEWLTLECLEVPSIASRQVNARRLARLPMTPKQLKELERREDFAAYVEELRKGPLEAARAKFLNAFPTYIDRHREALDLATQAKDYAAIARITEPVLDRVIPKKAEAMTGASVVVHLSVGQLAGLQGYAAPAVAVEEVIAEVVPDDDA